MRKTDSLHSTPLIIAIQTISRQANTSDKTPDAHGRHYIEIEAAQLCLRAMEQLLRRLVTPI